MAFRTNKTPVLQEKSASGSVASFNTALAMPLKSHTVALTATQSGSGTPSPSNPRLISGYSAINIGSDDKYAGFINFNQLVRNKRIGQTTTLSMPNSRTIVVSTNSIKSIPNHIYFISCNVTADTTSNGLNAQFGNIINFGQGIGVKNVIYVGLTELSYAYVYIGADEASGVTTTYKDFCIFDLTQMFGSTKADYIYSLEQGTAGSGVAYFRSLFPNDYYDYNAGTLTTVSAVNGVSNSMFTIQIGSTVYGGEYDARTGVLTVTHKSGVFDGSESWVYYTDAGAFYLDGAFDVDDTFRTDNVCLCNWLAESSSISNSSAMKRKPDLIFCNQTTSPQRLWVKMEQFTTDTDFKNYLSSDNLVIVYPLATPTTIQLPPCPIDTLRGENNIWANTGNTSLTYKDLDIAKRGNFREVFRLPS